MPAACSSASRWNDWRPRVSWVCIVTMVSGSAWTPIAIISSSSSCGHLERRRGRPGEIESMKVFVTGTDGYIGCQLSSLLMERGHDVTGLDTGYYRDGWLY